MFTTWRADVHVTNAFAYAATVAIVVSAAAQLPLETNDGCRTGPLAQFGVYLGDWDIEDERLQQDGTTWEPGVGARWRFVCVGNGVAIQDYWLPNHGGMGTNLRTYDLETGMWEIVWTASNAPGLTHIRAKRDDASGRIIMRFVAPTEGVPKRIIFFPPAEDGWRWQQEWSFDGGASWTPVYRIKATRRAEP